MSNLVPRVFLKTARGEGKTLVSAGHVSPRFWVINKNYTMGRVGEERVCRDSEYFGFCVLVSVFCISEFALIWPTIRKKAPLESLKIICH